MIVAAAVITRAVSMPGPHRDGSAAEHPLLVHPADQEHLVVHGQAEQDGQRHHRQEGLDRPGLPQAERVGPQPHWENAVSTPNEAAAASRFITATVAGMSRLRNATTSSRKFSPTIARMNHGSFAVTTAAKSANVAVTPTTYTRSVVPRSAGLPRQSGHGRL